MKNALLLFAFLGILKVQAQVKFIQSTKNTKTPNTVFIGMPNIFTISAPQETSVSQIISSQGNIRMNSDGTFSLYVHELSKDPLTLKYTATTNGSESVNNYPTQYTVKNMPSPYQLKVGDYIKSGKISLTKFKKNHLLSLVDIETKQLVNDVTISCSFSFSQQNGVQTQYQYLSTNTVKNQQDFENMISILKVGDKIKIEKINLSSPDGNTIELDDMQFLLVL